MLNIGTAPENKLQKIPSNMKMLERSRTSRIPLIYSPFAPKSFCYQGLPLPKIRGTRISGFDRYEHWKVEFECFPMVYGMPMLINIWVAYIVGKLLSSSSQWMCILWETRGTRTCIRVHVMDATGYDGLRHTQCSFHNAGPGRPPCRISCPYFLSMVQLWERAHTQP